MSCCGSQRTALHQEWTASGRGESRSESEYWTSGPIDFEYSGHGELSVTGPLSGEVYRFTANDRRVRVHGSDAPSLISVPGLRPVT
jgi:hypothetical protein